MYHRHIVIEGNIGSGKTSLATKLSYKLNVKLILEAFENNPFLPKFYKSPKKHAFPLELFFMAERYHQLKNLSEQDLFKPNVISDYFFVKSKLFAQNNLQDDELKLFNKLFDIMYSSLLQPSLVVYLFSDIKRLQKNIKKRGRVFEQNISDLYLTDIQDMYLDYLRKQKDFPVLILDVTGVDFVLDDNAYQAIQKTIEGNYDIGIHHKIIV